MTVLVTGATGAVGPRVVHALDQTGFRIRSFSVDTPTAAVFPQGVEVLIGDVLIKPRSNLRCEVWMQLFIWRRFCTL
jgi:uncharacterized protein YbjT (DUF2867 family)